MSKEAEPFLGHTREEALIRSTSNKLVLSVAAHVLLISLYTIGSLVFINNYTVESMCEYHLNAIDHLDVAVRPGSSYFYENTDYVGLPSPQTDALWSDLLRDRNIRVSKDELSRNDRNSVELPDGGYLAWIGVFHELHCVNLLRQWKYRDHYFNNTGPEEIDKIQRHTDHCLDRIRAIFMCHPDLSSLTTFFWDVEPQPKVNGTKTLHNCVDWNALIASSKWRRVEHEELSSLRNPLM